MEISAIFESWLIEDGVYPLLSKGDDVNLSFEVQFSKSEKTDDQTLKFDHIGFAEYEINAKIIRIYKDGSPLYVFDAGLLKFYSTHIDAKNIIVGDFIRGKGTLLFDHYIWAEFLNEYESPPNLFYNFTVIKILKAKIPEKFIIRSDGIKAQAAKVALSQLPSNYIEEITTMKGEKFDEKFYVITLNSKGVENKTIKKTFKI